MMGAFTQHSITQTLALLIFLLAVVYFISGLDDLFVDVIAHLWRLRPRSLDASALERLTEAREKRIAIIIPAWNEGEIIDRMLFGNLSRINYREFEIFVGVYPNDPATRQKVELVSKRCPNVHPVVNVRPGPTSKGQILNVVVQEIVDFETRNGMEFAALLMQDAEDIIHPLTLKLANQEVDTADFIQIPVFSLEAKLSQLVAGTYMDEFAESHTKDMLVRNALGAAIPSAGVGTVLSRRLWLALLRQHAGAVFNEGSLTEDYELGIRAHLLGFLPRFVCARYQNELGCDEFIATREYFPKKFSRSMRQKTRWSTGICVQGWRNMGWVGNIGNRYFLFRDRKGLFMNLASFLGYPCALAFGLAWYFDPRGLGALVVMPKFFEALIAFNTFLMANRFVQRVRCTWRIYGIRGAVPVVARWPVGILINALASAHAVRAGWQEFFRGTVLKWEKTEHELPLGFGDALTPQEG